MSMLDASINDINASPKRLFPPVLQIPISLVNKLNRNAALPPVLPRMPAREGVCIVAPH